MDRWTEQHTGGGGAHGDDGANEERPASGLESLEDDPPGEPPAATPGPPPVPREPPAAPGQPPPRRATRGLGDEAIDMPPSMRVALAISLGVGFTFAALPAAVLLWVVFALLATGVTAESLEQTGGLMPTTFGGGFWLALAVDVLVVLYSVVRRVIGKPSPWRPLAILVIAYAVLSWILIPMDWRETWDVPDVVTAFILIGGLQLVLYVLPVVLLVLLVRCAIWAWRVGSLAPEAAERIAALCLCLGVAGVSVTGALAAAGAEGYFAEFAPASDDLEPLAATFADSERQSMVTLADDIGPPAPAKYSRGGSAFNDCTEQLGASERDDRPLVDLAVTRLIRVGLSPSEAEDVAMETLLAVCLQHAERGVDDLTRYFWRAVRNNGWQELSRPSRRGRRDIPDVLADLADGEVDPRERLVLEENIAQVRRALEALPERDRHLLRLRDVDGLGYTEIGARLDISEAGARQAVGRARKRLRDAFERAAR